MAKKKHTTKKTHAKKTSHKKPHHDESSNLPDEQQIEDGLRSIYALDAEESEEQRVDMSKLEIVTTPMVRRVLIAVLLVLIAIAAGLAGAVILNNPFADTRDQLLTFDINTDDTSITSGEEVTITIPYENPGRVPLANVEVTLHVPETFQLSNASQEPIDDAPLTWNLGSIEPGTRGELRVTGRFYGPPGTAVTIQSITRYKPANFSSPFEDIVSESLLIEDSLYAVMIDGPDRAIPGETDTYTVTVEQTGEVDAADIELRLDLPQGFTIVEEDRPPVTENTPIWRVSPINQEEPFVLNVQGQFASDVSGDQDLTARAGTIINESFVDQAAATSTLRVLESDVSLLLIVNGQTGDSILLPGDDLVVNLSLNNRGEEAAEEMTVELFVDQGLERVQLGQRSGIPDGDQYGNKVNWDFTDMRSLETLRGGETASIDVAIPTAEEGPTTITLHAEAKITTIGGVEINRELSSSPITIQVAADISASSVARYYSNDGTAIGSGPLPPLAGEATTYRLTWTMASGSTTVEDAVMTAPIPENVSWSGVVSVTDGSITYDSVANRVRWSAGTLPNGGNPPIAVFDMRVQPTQGNVGSFMQILGPATVTGIDAQTGETVSSSAAAQTTELPNDPGAAGNGVVLEP